MNLNDYYNCNEMNMILEVTNVCNLKCTYCFEQCQTETRDNKVMSEDIMKRSVDFLLKNRKNCHLTFFGGEPCLYKNFVKKTIEYGNKQAKKRKKLISYSIVTNGTKLDDDFIQLLNENNVNIVFSFDGNEYSQNKYRRYVDGRNSYDTVLKNLKKLLDLRKDSRFGHLIVRPTITSEMIPYINDIYEEIYDMGVREISFSLVSAKRTEDYAIKEKDLERIEKQFKAMSENYLEELRKGYSYNKYIEGIVCKIKSQDRNLYFCDCGKRYVAIDVNGNVYPCEGFLGVEEFKMGNIYDKVINNEWICPQNVDECEICSKCWAKYLCGGSCYHEAWMMTNSINKKDEIVCETYKLSILYGLKIYSKILSESIEYDQIIKDDFLPTKTVFSLNDEQAIKVDEEAVYTNALMTNKIIRINKPAMEILELIDGKNSIMDICEEIKNRYQIQEDVYEDISDIINYFLDNNIIFAHI